MYRAWSAISSRRRCWSRLPRVAQHRQRGHNSPHARCQREVQRPQFHVPAESRPDNSGPGQSLRYKQRYCRHRQQPYERRLRPARKPRCSEYITTSPAIRATHRCAMWIIASLPPGNNPLHSLVHSGQVGHAHVADAVLVRYEPESSRTNSIRPPPAKEAGTAAPCPWPTAAGLPACLRGTTSPAQARNRPSSTRPPPGGS